MQRSRNALAVERIGTTVRSGGATEEELNLFHETQSSVNKDITFHAQEAHFANAASTSLQRIAVSTTSRAPNDGTSEDDLLTSDLGKNDYDWLLTPPGTPHLNSLHHTISAPVDSTFLSQNDLPNLMRSLAAIKTSRSSGAKPESMSRRLDTASKAHPIRHSSNGTLSKRSSFAPSSTPSSRSTTPTSRATKPSPFTSGRTVAPPSSITRPASSSRPASPLRRPATPVPSQTHSHSLARPSMSRTNSVAAISTPSSRGSSPITKPRTVAPPILPGFSLEPPPNLRTTAPVRSQSNSRGRPTTPTARMTTPSNTIAPGGGSTRAGSMVDTAPDRLRRPSSPSLARGRSSTMERLGSNNASMLSNGKAGSTPSQSFARGNQMAEKMTPSRRTSGATPSPPSLYVSEQSPVSLSKRNITRPTTPSNKDASGYGRNVSTVSKKSLDMTLRQLDIHQAPTNGFRSLLSNTHASSLYSVKSVNGRNWLSQTPSTTNSTLISGHGVNMHTSEGSELSGEISVEVGNKASYISNLEIPNSLVKDVNIDNWIGSPEYKDNTVESLKPSCQETEKAVVSEPSVVCPHGVMGNCELCNLKQRLWNLNQATKSRSIATNMKS